jgi:hypothetical protein
MRLLRLLGIVGLALLLALGTSPAQAAKKKATHAVHGTVVNVQRVDGKAVGTVTVEIHHKKKGITTTQVVDRKFKVANGTRVEIVKGKKGAQQHLPATFADVQNGEHVVLVVTGDVAQAIAIHQKAKQ